jgi:hypothetical protein
VYFGILQRFGLRNFISRKTSVVLTYVKDENAATCTCNYSTVMLTRCLKRILPKSSREGERRRKLTEPVSKIIVGDTKFRAKDDGWGVLGCD